MLVTHPLDPPQPPAGDIPTHVFSFARSHKDRVVLIDDDSGEKYTAGDIMHASYKLAAALTHRNAGGGLISVFDDRDLRCITVYYAALLAGGAYQGIPLDMDQDQLRRWIKTTGTNVIFASSKTIRRARQAAAGLAIAIYTFDACADADSLDEILRLAPEHPQIEPVPGSASRLALLVCSETAGPGPGGMPRAVMHSHRSVLAGRRMPRSAPRGPESLTAVSAVPFVPAIGNLAHLPMLSGSCLVQLHSDDVGKVLAAVERHGGGVLIATRRVLVEIASRVRRASASHVYVDGLGAVDVSTLKVVFVHAMRVRQPVKDRIVDVLGARVVELYGYPETGVIAGMVVEHPRIKDSVGLLAPGVSAKVVADDGRVCAPGECGEILVNTPRLMMGYLDQQQQLAPDAYFATGDFGFITALGSVVVKCRMADVIYLPAGPVSPSDIEDHLLAGAGCAIADCAAVGVRGPMGDAVHIYVVLSGRDDQGSIDHVRAVGSRKYPGVVVEAIDRILRDPDGTILRSELPLPS